MLSDQHYIHNASSLYLVTRTFWRGLCFHVLFRWTFSTGMTQIGCLLAVNWKAPSLSSRSLMWHETEELPAGVTLWPCLGLLGLLRPAKPRVPLRNVAQTWLQFSPHHTEMFGLSYSYKNSLMHPYQLELAPSLSCWCKADSQGRWSCQSSHALRSAPSPY